MCGYGRERVRATPQAVSLPTCALKRGGIKSPLARDPPVATRSTASLSRFFLPCFTRTPSPSLANFYHGAPRFDALTDAHQIAQKVAHVQIQRDDDLQRVLRRR